MTELILLIVLVAFSLVVGLAVRSVLAIELDILGDVGTNTNAKKNVALLAKGNECLLGVGDYQYQDKVSAENQKLWDSVECKVGVPGNHEEEKDEAKDWAATNFKYGDRGYASWKLTDRDSSKPSVAVIGLNTYTDFEQGSDQYNWLVSKINQYKDRKDISWIVIASHEPTATPTIEGGHGLNKKLRDVVYPLIAGLPNVILASGHNHVTAFGTVQNVNHVICGGGGKGGDSLGKLNGFEFATVKDFGHCDLSILPDSVKVSLIDVDGTRKAGGIFSK